MPVDISAPHMLPDGTGLLIDFKYGKLPRKLAAIPTNPDDRRIRIFEPPPTMSWFDPCPVPDATFLAASYCQGERCYEEASGSHVWRFKAQPKNNLDRLTPATSLLRHQPFVAWPSGDLFSVLVPNASAGARFNLNSRYLVQTSGSADALVFPNDGAEPMNGLPLMSPKLHMMQLAPSQGFDGRTLYFTGTVLGGSLPVVKQVEAVSGFFNRTGSRYDPRLFRWTGGDEVELLRKDLIAGVHASRSGAGYVFVSGGFRKHAIEDVRDGKIETRLKFTRGFVDDISADDSLETIVFKGQRDNLQRTVWMHRTGMADAVDLEVPERLATEVARQIESERATLSPPP